MSKLHDAAQAGNVPAVQHLLAGGVGVDEGDAEDWTALMWGAPFLTVTEMLLAAGADPNHSTSEGESVLMAFARRGTPATIRVLLAAGARLDYTDATGNNAMMEAAAVGKLDTIPVLVEAGLGPNARTSNGATALFGAAREGEWETVKLLLGLGADPLIEITGGPDAGQTALALGRGAQHVGTALALENAETRARAAADAKAATEHRTYELWEDGEGGLTFFDATDRSVPTPLRPGDRLVWTVEALDWNAACQARNDFLGWGPYVPYVDPGQDDR